MRWLRGARGIALGPVMMMAVMCGDSPAPGACSGCTKTEPHDHGVVACTMQVDGAERPCRGEWYHWPNQPSYSLRLWTFDPAGALSSSATVDLDEAGGAEPAEVTFESFPHGGGALRAYAWVKGAGSYGSEIAGGGVGTLHLSTRRPPTGTFSGTLAPCVDPGHLSSLSGPPGTTVSVEVSFVPTTQ